jgi:glycosyltransferase involved in cell wall biosynthesis
MPLDDTRFARGKGSFKIIQYMGAGLPSIASSVGFNKQVIVDGETGYLVGCSEDWIEAILRLSEDRSFWNTMSGDARKRWEAEYSYNANLAALAGTISEAIQRG